MVEAIDPALLRSIGEVSTILGFASMPSEVSQSLIFFEAQAV